MEWRLIKTEKQYRSALKKLETLFDAVEGTPDGEQAELLALLIEKYEEDHYPVLPPEPLEAIRFRMEQLGLRKTDMARIFGYRSRVSEVLSGTRKLNLPMIRRLHKALNIPYEVLVREY